MGIADLFRPKYRHSNVAVRAEAVRQLSNEESDVAIAINIARKDSDASIRRLALDKIDDPEVLVELAADEGDGDVRAFAERRAAGIWVSRAVASEDAEMAEAVVQRLVSLGDQHAIAEVASRANLTDIRDAALVHLDDDKALSELARNPKTHMAARKTAVARIGDVEVLRSIAIDENRKDVALAASERIDDLEVLELVATKAKNKTVRTRTRKRLNELQKATAREAAPVVSQEEQRRHAERVQLVRRAEVLSQGQPSKAAGEEMEAIKDTLADIGGAGELSDRVERALIRFDKRQAVWQEREDARLAELTEKERKAAAEDRTRSPEPTEDGDATAEAGAAPAADGDAAAETAGAADSEAGAAGDETEAENEAEKRRKERETKKRERREQALADLAALTEELRTGTETDQRKAAEKLLQKADKKFSELNLGNVDHEIVHAYKEARKALFLKVQELRDAAGWKQWANIAQQEALIAQAKALLDHEDKSNLGKRLKALQTAWKEVGPAPRKKGQELWETFKATCDQIYEQVKEQRARQGEIQAANLVRKIEICERVEVLAESTDWDATADEIKALQREWKAIGPVPRKKSDAVWKRFRGACDLFFERRKPHMEQRMAEFEKNLEDKQAMCEQAEALAESTDWVETAAKLRQMQRDWRDIGMVPRKDANAINKRFRSACDRFFKRRKEYHEEQRRAHEQKLTDLRAEIAAIARLADSDEPLSEADSADAAGADTGADAAPNVGDVGDVGDVTDGGGVTDGGDVTDGGKVGESDESDEIGEGAGIAKLVARTLAVRSTLRELAPEGKLKRSLYDQANQMFRSMLAWYRAEFEGTELDPAASEPKKRKLLAKAEELAPPEETEKPVEEEAQTPEQMAEKLRAALAQNALSNSLANSTDGRNMADSIAELQDDWLVIGPVPGADGDELEARFASACERALRSAGVHSD